MRIRLGTRGSPLALWQARHVRERLAARHPGLSIEIIEVTTTGDRNLAQPLAEIGQEGLFTKEVEEALLSGRIDVAVHSCKDVPTALPPDLALAAVLERVQGGDVLISKGRIPLAKLPPGAVLATGSLRRQAQLLHYRRDLSIVNLRGNLNTRFRKFQESDWAGMVLAEAGVARLEMQDQITERISADVLLPAVGQGALALETRADDAETLGLVSPLRHAATADAVAAERAFLHRLRGGCQIPVGALATVSGERLRLEGVIASLDGALLYRDAMEGRRNEGTALGIALAEELLAQGARAVLDRIRAGN